MIVNHFMRHLQGSITWLASNMAVYNNKLLYNVVGCIQVQQHTVTRTSHLEEEYSLYVTLI